MDILVIAGAVLAGFGLFGLAVCILRAIGLRREARDGADVSKRLQGLAALNMAALGVAGIGLAMVVVGLLLDG